MAAHIELGKTGEQIAKEYLIRKGYEILEQNWQFNRKEIDIIARNKGLIIVVEVKTRSSDYFGNPEEAVTVTKQKFLIEAADQYLQQLAYDAEVRYDILSILITKKGCSINHIEEAFIPLID